MAAFNYPRALKGLRISEGGWSNHPKDPGGATMYGIIQREYDAFRKRKGLPLQSVRLISEAEVAEIYKTQYADKVRFDDLPAGIDYATLDGAVNSGVSRGTKWLQQALGVSADGVVGNQTVSKAVAADARKTIQAMCSKRLGFLQGLKTFSTFGRGWSSRIARVEAEAVSMALSSRGAAPARIADAARIESETARKNSQTVATSAATSGSSGAVTASQVDWFHLGSTGFIVMIVAIAGLAVATVYLVHRRNVQKSRADAYAAVAADAAISTGVAA